MTAVEDVVRVHGTALVVGEAGVLLRGPSGSGKSSLALALLAEASRRGVYNALVADDRVAILARGGRLIARCVPGFEGKIERRGIGLVTAPWEKAAVMVRVFDLSTLGEAPDRMPEREGQHDEILGVRLPRNYVSGLCGLSERVTIIGEMVGIWGARLV